MPANNHISFTGSMNALLMVTMDGIKKVAKQGAP